MQRIYAEGLKSKAGKTVKVQGWLYKKRELGGMTFLLLRDRTGLIQVLDEKSNETKKLEGLYNGTILTITGNVVEDVRAPMGIEIHEPKITVEVSVEFVAPIEIDKPIDHSPENLETLFENRVVGLRNIDEQKIFKIQASVGKSLREFFEKESFTEIRTPKLLAEATEGGAEVFKTDYFGRLATLAQSPQFYKQMMVGVFERVYEIAPVYRAEPSMTTRHMTEYISVDAEMGFIERFSDLTNLLSALTFHVCDTLWKNNKNDLEALQATKPILTKKFPEITLNKLHKLYLKETGRDLTKEKDPSPEEERWITEYSKSEWGCEAVFITEFPASSMKFYHYKSETNPLVAERADLIFRGVEIVTTSRREHRYPKLIEQLKDIGGNPENPGYKYFLQAFRYGMPNHGGFGLGLERLTQKIIGLNSVKEASLFPRDINRLAP